MPSKFCGSSLPIKTSSIMHLFAMSIKIIFSVTFSYVGLTFRKTKCSDAKFTMVKIRHYLYFFTEANEQNSCSIRKKDNLPLSIKSSCDVHAKPYSATGLADLIPDKYDMKNQQFTTPSNQ